MKIQDLAGKNICMLGYGKEGHAMVAALEKYAPACEITIADQNENVSIDNKHWVQLGTSWLKNLDKFDVLIKSPGIPPNPELTAHAAKLTTPTQIFFDSISDSGALTIGVTGSKGKSTTASLIHHLLQTQNEKLMTESYLVGNIGDPAISHLDDAAIGITFVMELSSYQLMDLHTSPNVAVITSFFPEHLDYHGSVQAYMDAKKNIARFQTEHDAVFFSSTSVGAGEIAKEGRGVKIPFSSHDAPLPIEDTHLIGEHNLSNIAGAFKVARMLGVPETDAIEGIKTFQGLSHRLQSLGIHHDLEWVDDAISTTPESTIAALDALGDRVSAIILGGQDRGYDFTELGKRIAASNVSIVVLFPGSGPKIKTAIEQAGATVTFFEVDSMEKAVTEAKRATSKHIVLLSTASPSYGMFKNFEEKGDCFKKAIAIS